MPKRPDIYELLAAQQASDTTTTQLNSALKSTYIYKSNIEFWAGVITGARALEESRTNSHGLPIPEAGDVMSLTIANGQTASVKPTVSSEVWLVQGIHTADCAVALYDGSEATQIDITKFIGTPLYVTESLYLSFSNGTGDTALPTVAYNKVSL